MIREISPRQIAKAIEDLLDENEQLKNDYNKVVHEATEFESKVYELQDRINKAIEYINKFENIKAYYSYEENGYEEYNYDEDFKIDLLEILKGGEEEC